MEFSTFSGCFKAGSINIGVMAINRHRLLIIDIRIDRFDKSVEVTYIQMHHIQTSTNITIKNSKKFNGPRLSWSMYA